MIREPMYKYRKDVKEKFFKDNYMAFYWMYYRFMGEIKVSNDRESLEAQRVIYEDFDKLAIDTLR